MKPTSVSFERRYSDDSGVEFGVSFDRDGIHFEAVDTISFPIEELGWLIECLTEIRNIQAGQEG